VVAQQSVERQGRLGTVSSDQCQGARSLQEGAPGIVGQGLHDDVDGEVEIAMVGRAHRGQYRAPGERLWVIGNGSDDAVKPFDVALSEQALCQRKSCGPESRTVTEYLAGAVLGLVGSPLQQVNAGEQVSASQAKGRIDDVEGVRCIGHAVQCRGQSRFGCTQLAYSGSP
jgi:hypothetical protein